MQLDQTRVASSNVATLGDPFANISIGRYALASATEVIDHAALDDLLLEYYGVIVRKLAVGGFPKAFITAGLKATFWLNIDKFLPPSQRLILVHDDAGRLVGCGTLQQINADAVEVKRPCVRRDANDHGLVRAIVDARLQSARQMGWSKILVNGIRGNQDMLRIYQSLGFEFIDRYPGCSDPIEMDPYLVYMQLELD